MIPYMHNIVCTHMYMAFHMYIAEIVILYGLLSA